MIAATLLMLPVAAGASVDTGSALHAYMRGRLADGDGAPAVALDHYRLALTRDPARSEVARRSYVQAMVGGDLPLALRSASVLEREGLLPRDGTLLFLADAISRKNWSAARLWVDRMVEEGNFAFLAPIIRSWISVGEGRYLPPVVDPDDRFASLTRRYLDEHLALLSLRSGTLDLAAANKALASRTGGQELARLFFAAQLAAKGGRDEAIALLPENSANVARARKDISAGKISTAHRKPLNAAQGFSWLLLRLASDISSDDNRAMLGLRLARIASLTDRNNPAGRILTADVLNRSGHATLAAAEVRPVIKDNWYGPLAQAELIEALAADDQRPEAIALARAMASVPDAEAERHVRLGQLLAQEKDFAGAAAAFRAARARYDVDKLPWPLLLLEGSALEQGGRWDEARQVLERALQLAPDEPTILNHLGYAQIERRQNLDAALQLVRKASKLKPDDAAITDSLGWAKYVTGNVTGAVPVLERAAAAAPTDPTINEHLGDALWAAGRRFEARYAWRAAALFAEGEMSQRLAAKTKEGMKPEYAAR